MVPGALLLGGWSEIGGPAVVPRVLLLGAFEFQSTPPGDTLSRLLGSPNGEPVVLDEGIPFYGIGIRPRAPRGSLRFSRFHFWVVGLAGRWVGCSDLPTLPAITKGPSEAQADHRHPASERSDHRHPAQPIVILLLFLPILNLPPLLNHLMEIACILDEVATPRLKVRDDPIAVVPVDALGPDLDRRLDLGIRQVFL